MIDSGWWDGLTREAVTHFNGLDQTISQVDQLREGKTNFCEGFSQHGSELTCDKFGFSALHVNWTRDSSRCYGIVPVIGTPGKFYTVFAKVNGSSLTTARDFVSIFDMSVTNLDTTNPKYLVAHAALNGHSIMADGGALRKYKSSTVYNTLVEVADSPTFGADSSTGISGVYYYRCTLTDSNGNETGGGDPSDAHYVSNQTINPALDITGMDTAVKGYSKIRWYRTAAQSTHAISSGGATVTITVDDTSGVQIGTSVLLIGGTNEIKTVTAYTATTITFGSVNATTHTSAHWLNGPAKDLTYYYLGSAKDSTIVPATTSYTIADNLLDDDITLNAPMLNPDPIILNGQTLVADIVISFQNRLVAFNPTVNGTAYPGRVMWSDLSDSTETAVGNIYSWNADDFADDLGINDGHRVIGAWELGGRMFVSKANGTWVFTPTYSSTRGQQYAVSQIDGRIGFYHHTIKSIGGNTIGRSDDGIYIFNGSTFRSLTEPIHGLFQRLGTPEGDTAAYDYSVNRYYVSVYDTTYLSSYIDTGSNQGLARVFRNTLVCIDLGEKKVEVHPGTFIQYFQDLEDSTGQTNIFYGGDAKDIGIMLFDSLLTGPSLTFLGTRSGDYTLNSGLSLQSTSMIGKTVRVFAYVDVTNSKLMFTNYENTISSAATATFTLDSSNPRIPFFQSSNTLLCAIDAASGTSSGSGTGGTHIVDNGSNFFLANNLNYYAAAHDQANGGQSYGGLILVAPTVSAYNTLDFSTGTGIVSGNKYVIIPHNVSATAAFPSEVPSRKYLTPCFGSQNSTQSKMFRHLLIRCKGSGIIRIRTFLNGADPPVGASTTGIDQTVYLTLTNTTTYKGVLVNLKGSIGQFMRVELTSWKGASWVSVSEFSCFWKPVGGLRGF